LIHLGSPAQWIGYVVTHILSRVMVHEAVLDWHEQNTERERKAQAFVEEMDDEQAISSYVFVDSD
jgi:hypothetical protein